MNLDHHLQKQLKALHLGGVFESLDLRLQQAQSSSLGYIEYIEFLSVPSVLFLSYLT